MSNNINEAAFNAERLDITNKELEILHRIQYLQNIIAENQYRLILLESQKIDIYKKFGKNIPHSLSHPELFKIKETAEKGMLVIKNKIDDFLDFCQKNGIERDFFQQKYIEYRKTCYDQKIATKSNFEIKRILLSIGNLKEKLKDVSLYEMLNSVSKQVEEKKSMIGNSFQKHYTNTGTDSEKDREKHVTLFCWAQLVEKQLDGSVEIDYLYAEYLNYLKTNMLGDTTDLIFDLHNGDFAKALDKYKNIKVIPNEYNSLGI